MDFKKLLAHFFLWLYLFNVGGYVLVFQLEMFSIKERVKSAALNDLNNPLLSHFHFKSLRELQQMNYNADENELSYGGANYDILMQTNDHGSILVIAIKDVQEEQLMAGLQQHINLHVSGNSSSKSSKAPAAVKINNLKFCQPVYLLPARSEISLFNINGSADSFEISEGHLNSTTPPPNSIA